MIVEPQFASPLEIDGRTWLRGALSEAQLAPFDSACALSERPGARMQAAAALGAAIAPTAALAALVREALPFARPVRAAVFAAGPSAPEAEPWRQDREILVAERAEVDGFSNWSSKGGIWHVEAPESVLERMVVARVLLDDWDEAHGGRQFALGSHRAGAVSGAAAEEAAAKCPWEPIGARRGDVVLTKMLTLHRTVSGAQTLPRRSVRVDYAAEDLPEPLDWAM
ncbi:hypothetical protein ACQ5SO_09235 [Rhodovulum sp. DZ06]|uniref:hypothetical protein n=1 Tax=Rhodovulum sp. DZ06 TaxID=3425126 RepID=UPI003D33BF91